MIRCIISVVNYTSQYMKCSGVISFIIIDLYVNLLHYYVFLFFLNNTYSIENFLKRKSLIKKKNNNIV